MIRHFTSGNSSGALLRGGGVQRWWGEGPFVFDFLHNLDLQSLSDLIACIGCNDNSRSSGGLGRLPAILLRFALSLLFGLLIVSAFLVYLVRLLLLL